MSSWACLKMHTLEINLRSGGTTHPYETLRLLTDSELELDNGTAVTSDGKEK